MQNIISVALCFVFASMVTGQGPFINPIGSLSGGGFGAMPPHIARVLGSTVNGQNLVGGMDGFPQHGGAGVDAVDGLRNGWGADPNEQLIPAVSNWQDPWNNAAYPVDYQGEDLIFDPVQNRYHRQQQAKEVEHIRVKNGGMPLGGAFGKPIGGVGPVVGPAISPVGHHVAKSSGIIKAGKPSYIGRQPMHVGVVGKPKPGMIAPNMGKTSGIGFINPVGHVAQGVKHNMAKSGSMLGRPIGGGYVGLSQLNTGIVHPHHIVKASMEIGSKGVLPPKGGIGPIGGVFPPKGGIGPIGGVFPPKGGIGPIGGVVAKDPIHAVHKVSQSGIAAIGHDPLAANIGHSIAKQTIGESAHAVNIGSNGGVARGNPVAVAAAHGLAKESIHVAGKTLGIASQTNPISKHGPIGVGQNIFGGVHPQPIHHQPIQPMLPRMDRRFRARGGGY